MQKEAMARAEPTTDVKLVGGWHPSGRKPASTVESSDDHAQSCNVTEHMASTLREQDLLDEARQIPKRTQTRADHCRLKSRGERPRSSIQASLRNPLAAEMGGLTPARMPG